MLWIFVALKNPSSSAMDEPPSRGSNDKYASHYTTEYDELKVGKDVTQVEGRTWTETEEEEELWEDRDRWKLVVR
jgi:hypothetical protein